MKREVTDFWEYDELFASWGYYFEKDKGIQYEELPNFIDKYIALGLKYGINLHPLFLKDDVIVNNIEEVKDQILKSEDDLWVEVIHRKMFSEEINRRISTSYFFLKNGNDKISGQVLRNTDFFSKLTSIENKSLEKLYISLDSNCFISLITGVDEEGFLKYYDNSELAYLNTTRLNSYLRDLTILMFEFGANELGFSDQYGIFYKDGESAIFEDIYLKIQDKVIFYEDVYDKLSEEHKYKLFEQIHITLDDTNYKKYKELSKE